MPKIGDVKGAKEITKKGHNKYIWHACVNCGKERWVALGNNRPAPSQCWQCAMKQLSGKNNPNWKGGKHKSSDGYIYIRLQPDDFFHSMVMKDGYVREHRLVVAKALGRNLHSWEIIHHKRGYAKDDNRYPKTLQLVTDERHNQITILEAKIDRSLKEQGRLQNRVTLLEAENTLLRRQIRDMLVSYGLFSNRAKLLQGLRMLY